MPANPLEPRPRRVPRNALREESQEVALLVPLTAIGIAECRSRTLRAARPNAREQRLDSRWFAVPIPICPLFAGARRFPVPDVRANLVARPESLRLRGLERGGDPSKVLAFPAGGDSAPSRRA